MRVGTLPGHVAAVDVVYNRRPSIGSDPSCIPGLLSGVLPCVVREFVEILLGGNHTFLIIWLIHMSPLKERERIIPIYLCCVYSLAFVFLT